MWHTHIEEEKEEEEEKERESIWKQEFVMVSSKGSSPFTLQQSAFTLNVVVPAFIILTCRRLR